MYGSHSNFGSLRKPARLRHEPRESPVVAVPEMRPFVQWRAVKGTEEFALCSPNSIQFYRSLGTEEDSFTLTGAFSLGEGKHKATCFDHCYADPKGIILGFLGLSSGQLLSLQRDFDGDRELITHLPLLSRNTPCVCLRASKAQSIVAAGYLKTVNEKPVVVVDINDNKRYEAFLKKTEVATSIDFQNNLAQIFVVGTESRMIHIVDRRAGGAIFRSWTAGVNGNAPIQVTFCPFEQDLLASYSADSDSVLLFDLRYLCRNKNRVEVQAIVNSPCTQEFKWTENSKDYRTFWTLHGKTSTLSSWEMRDNRQEINSPVYSRNFSKNIFSVDPHPSDKNTWVVVNEDLQVKLFDLRKKNAVQFSSSGEIALAMGSSLHFPHFDNSEDSTDKMRRRLDQGYGFNVVANVRLLGEEGSELKFVWSWMKEVFRIQKSTDRMNNILSGGVALREVRQHVMNGLLSTLTESEASEVATASLLDMEIDVHNSPVRESILRLCGWGSDPEKINHLKESGQFDVAAALYLFQFDPEKDFFNRASETCDILLQAADAQINIPETLTTEMHMVAITLSGCGKQLSFKDRYKISARRAAVRLTSPYLRAIINFILACDKQTPVKYQSHFELIIKDREIPVKDRLAFAARFLVDSELLDYVKGLCNDFIKEGDLQGIMIVGMNNLQDRLFDIYLEKTNDIQTIALICCYLKSLWGPLWQQHLEGFKKFERLISMYRDILNQWECFTARCLFDKETQDLSNQKPKMPPSVQACCLICSAPLMTEKDRPMIGGNRFAPVRISRNVSFACKKCNTMFPRCCLCLKTFWTSKTPEHKELNFGKKGKDQVAASWFTWCQACHHGGHLSCITSWFEQSKKCAVAGCDCNCFESEYEEFSRVNRMGSTHSPLNSGLQGLSPISISPLASFHSEI